MIIRKGKLSDLKELHTLLNQTPQLQGGTGEEIYSKIWIKSALTDKERELFLIAEEKKEIIGFLSAELWRNKRYSFLIDLFVKPRWREKGIAATLMKTYEKQCRKMKITRIIGLVLTSNKRMQKFIEKKSYRKGGTFYFYEKRLK